MAKITKIKASDPGKSSGSAPKKPQKTKKEKVVSDTPKPQKASKKASEELKKPFILIRPFVYLGRYIRDSWREIRQVRWPSRKATWKLVLAIFVYTGIFIALIVLLDMLFTWIFGLLIK